MTSEIEKATWRREMVVNMYPSCEVETCTTIYNQSLKAISRG